MSLFDNNLKIFNTNWPEYKLARKQTGLNVNTILNGPVFYIFLEVQKFNSMQTTGLNLNPILKSNNHIQSLKTKKISKTYTQIWI